MFVEDTPLKYKEVSKNDKFPYSFSYFKNPKVNNFQYDLGNNQKPKTFQKSFAKSKCIVCEIFVKAIRFFLELKLPIDSILAEGVKICNKFYVPEICQGAVDMFKGEVVAVFGLTKLKSAEICEVLTTQNCSGHEIEALKWILKIPPRSNKQRTKTKNKLLKKKVLQVLHVSDIHLDLQYKPSSNARCNEPLCCRQGQPEKPEDGAGFWGDHRNCDLPAWTLEEAFVQMSKQHYDYVVWTGDAVSHDIWHQSAEEQVSVLKRITGLFDRYLRDTPVYSALGNHEGVPVNSFPTPSSKHSSAWLYDTVYNLWSPWLAPDAKETVLKAGFYTTKFGSFDLRIVSLNMNFCNNLNGWLLLNATDPYNQLQWLIGVLLRAEKVQEKVHVIGHIPPGAPECIKWWSFNYNRIVRRFKETIVAQFFGHRHFDSFEIFFDDDEGLEGQEHAIGVAFMSPSLTTFPTNNPSYRIYELRPSDWVVIDHTTFIMDLNLSNANNKTNWRLEYTAKEAYAMSDLSAESFSNLAAKMMNDQKLFDLYFNFYYKSYSKGISCNQECRRMMICSLLTSESYNHRHCDRLLHHSGRSVQEMQHFQQEYLEWASRHKVC